MLSVDGLGVRYGTTRAVESLELEVGAGEVVALLGANGAGKTSTLRAISGLARSTGAVRFDGVDVSSWAPDRRARLGLVHVPEGRRIFPTLSVEENLLVGASARAGRPETFSLAEVYDLFAPLRPLRRRGGWALSGGEQQMVAVGRALMSAPRLLLLDEPSLGLAPIRVRELFAALGEISSRVPMLLVEQNTTVALSVSARAYVMATGRVVLSGPADSFGDRRELISRYLGQHDLPDAAVAAALAPTTLDGEDPS